MYRQKLRSTFAGVAMGLVSLGTTMGAVAGAADLKLLSASALHPAIDDLIPDFEKSSGHKVTVDYGTAGAVAERVLKGEAADIILSSVQAIGRLETQGKVLAENRIVIAKVGVGAFVRKGAAKPDMSSADAFKRAMLAARSIAYPDPAGGGASGVYVANLLERMEIAGEMKPKTRLSTLETLYASVATGEVEIGFNQVSEILAQPTVELIAPLPLDIQNYTQFAPGIITGSNQADAAKALVAFLSSPASRTVLKTKGFE
ncbi:MULTISPECIES: molybdate ABC transporter substrate-binding protein [Bradyrhizobium]|uniref:molybdate ABC transporter substrate-binding protein n=1 Tax=Bradyrhizobium TaxID=374 RepID=UPI000A18EC71|nr:MULTISPECIES: molybdate ABC transporter substrate-binding protein [Bradyrhizobium]OSI22514.1 molybdate ABC transporter substrate-binding protein [Bradyrhizobium canariense]OSI28131.1 molybdate ABC transporter substrate-binding protein [Bradyrhizobium canariense]OSI46120.1 molybdate ABC transporter substrate-binding protein [Bradyrhizobium canariense]OSI48439.1 molybdate ABC transporter substrate-binding protein [Bradyrhizobium canariense]OSI53477.1 molybdate ABC transporter substrate-bindin